MSVPTEDRGGSSSPLPRAADSCRACSCASSSPLPRSRRSTPSSRRVLPHCRRGSTSSRRSHRPAVRVRVRVWVSVSVMVMVMVRVRVSVRVRVRVTCGRSAAALAKVPRLEVRHVVASNGPRTVSRRDRNCQLEVLPAVHGNLVRVRVRVRVRV